ncbi:MAG: cytochrome-c oxidase, cbb3-type subunit III [Alphaproteobacteria bacterium]
MTDEHKDIDQPTGIETTGHEWDGLKELNNPLPRWWLNIFYATVVIAVIYMVLYPAIPLIDSYTKGLLNNSDREQVEADVEALRAERAEKGAGLQTLSLEEVRSDPALLEFALAAGASAFGDNCATCHGRGAQGFVGYPNLNDDAWIWGGTLDAIYTTLLYGIRSGDDQARFNIMPAYGKDGIFTEDQVNDLVEYVVNLSGREADQAAVSRASTNYEEQCSACHGLEGKGIQDLGAPNLSDNIWLYGGDRDALYQTIYYSRAGVMPGWKNRLTDTTIRALAIYVHSLGGGEEETVEQAALE